MNGCASRSRMLAPTTKAAVAALLLTLLLGCGGTIRHYSTRAYLYSVDVLNVRDQDRDGYFESFALEIDADTPTSVDEVFAQIDASTGDSWVTDSWIIHYNWTSDNVLVSFNMSEFSLARPTAVRITVSLYYAGGGFTGSAETVLVNVDDALGGYGAPYIYSTALVDTVDRDGDGYYESFGIEIDADVPSGSADVCAHISASTGDAWTTDSWHIVGDSASDVVVIPFAASEFSLSSPANVRLDIYLWYADNTPTGSTDRLYVRVDAAGGGGGLPFIYSLAIVDRDDADADGYLEAFGLEIDADVPGGGTEQVYARITASTSDSWTTDAWTITGDLTSDNAAVPFVASDFSISSRQSITLTARLFLAGGMDTGSQASVTVRVDGPAGPSVPYIYSLHITDRRDGDGDGYYESFGLEIDADVPGGGTASVYARITASTGDAWTTDIWTITGDATSDNAVIPFDSSDFGLSYRTAVTLTVHLYLAGGVDTGSRSSITVPVDTTSGRAYIYDTYIVDTQDRDYDGYYESFGLEIDADVAGGGSERVYARISASSGDAWTTDDWTITGDLTSDNVVVPFDASEFSISYRQSVTLTTELFYASGAPTYSTDAVSVRVDY